MNGSKDVELFIRDLSGIVVGDWKLVGNQVNEQQVEDPIEMNKNIVEVSEVNNLDANAEYVFDGDNGTGNEWQARDRNSNNELEDNNQGKNDLESDEDE